MRVGGGRNDGIWWAQRHGLEVAIFEGKPMVFGDKSHQKSTVAVQKVPNQAPRLEKRWSQCPDLVGATPWFGGRKVNQAALTSPSRSG